MPICGNTDNSIDHVPYFKSLKELDDWKPKGSGSGFNGTVKYTPRQPVTNLAGKGKLLVLFVYLHIHGLRLPVLKVCHDYKVHLPRITNCAGPRWLA